MASEEMLKKLLEEFVEKETFVTEELKLMTEQIVQLESKLDGCRARLSTIGADRDKVLSIRSRYSDGTFYSSSASPSSLSPLSHASTYQAPAPAPTIEPTPVIPTKISATKVTGSVPIAPVVEAAPIAAVQPQTVVAEPTPALSSPADPVAQPRRTLTGLNAILAPRKPDGSAAPPPPPPANFSNPEPESPADSNWESQLQPEPAPWQPAPEPQWTSSAFLDPGSAGATDEETPAIQWEMAAADEAPALPPSMAQDDPPAAPIAPADKGSEKNNVDLGNAPAEEGDNDTVKNINDALRSLFR